MKSIDQIPGSRAYHRRTQPLSEDNTLTSSIKYLIIDTILKIQKSIATISHSETEEDPEFHNLLEFPEGDSTFYDFLEAQVGGSEPLKPPQTNPPCTNIPCP